MSEGSVYHSVIETVQCCVHPRSVFGYVQCIYNVMIIKFSTDLFATDGAASSKPKKSKTGTKKKSKKATSEPKDYSMFDADAPSIFD